MISIGKSNEYGFLKKVRKYLEHANKHALRCLSLAEPHN